MAAIPPGDVVRSRVQLTLVDQVFELSPDIYIFSTYGNHIDSVI